MNKKLKKIIMRDPIKDLNKALMNNLEINPFIYPIDFISTPLTFNVNINSKNIHILR